MALFDSFELQLQNSVPDKSTSWPQNANFLAQLGALELILSGDNDYIQYEKEKGHFIPFNTLNTDTETSDIYLANKKKLHSSQSDRKGPHMKNYSKRLYATLPLFPFRSMPRFLQNNCAIPSKKTIIPPMSHIKLILRRNRNFDLTYLGDNISLCSPTDVITNTPRNLQGENALDADPLISISVEIHDIFLTCTSAIPEENFSIYNDSKYISPFGYSKVDIHDLTLGSTLYTPELIWPTAKVPCVAVLFFIPDCNIVYDSSYHLTTSPNRFYLPRGLKSIRIQQRTQIGVDPLNCFSIQNLEKRDYDDSKQAFFDYLIEQGFLSKNISFEDWFSIDPSEECGSLNIFPINFSKLADVEGSVLTKGLRVTLEFNQPLTTAWKLISVFWYLGSYCFKEIEKTRPPLVQILE